MVDILIPAAMLLLAALSAWSAWKAWLEPRFTDALARKPREEQPASRREAEEGTRAADVVAAVQPHSTKTPAAPAVEISERELSSLLAGGLLVLAALSLAQSFTESSASPVANSQARIETIAWAVALIGGGLIIVLGPRRRASRVEAVSPEELADPSGEDQPQHRDKEAV